MLGSPSWFVREGKKQLFIFDDRQYLWQTMTTEISLTASLLLLFDFTGWPGRDGTERDGTTLV